MVREIPHKEVTLPNLDVMLRTLDFSPQRWGATEGLGAGELRDHFQREGVCTGQRLPRTGDGDLSGRWRNNQGCDDVGLDQGRGSGKEKDKENRSQRKVEG